uniref:cytokinin riboside 5'-monophosphate phosphoribohydrolase n=1 Tax=Cajanus cajan TaxID=3821 RepID=A0A151TTC3_CAJCA|nr:UPF0717 protein At5g11950 family [Cajanus cajan]
MEEGYPRSKFKTVCVFCGSNSGNRQVFSDAAIQLGNELVKRNIDLVYGGGSVGLMGLISQRVHDGGCHVLGIIPKALMPLENLLSGNVGLLNVDGYYNCLLALFDNGVKEGFIKPGARNIVVSAPSAKELMMKMEHYTPSHEHVASHESWQMKQLGNYPGREDAE